MYGEEVSPLIFPHHLTMGSKLPQPGPGRIFVYDRQKRQKDQLHFDHLKLILTLNRDKFGTGFGIGTILRPK